MALFDTIRRFFKRRNSGIEGFSAPRVQDERTLYKAIAALETILAVHPDAEAGLHEIMAWFENEFAGKVFFVDEPDKALAWRERTYAARTIRMRIETLKAWRKELRHQLEPEKEESDAPGNF